jgi:hypothetical protein
LLSQPHIQIVQDIILSLLYNNNLSILKRITSLN